MTASYRFGPYRLDAKATILFRGTEPLGLGQRAVALLRVLVERAGEPISKDTLIEAAWPSMAIEDSNLAVQIAALRRVFAEDQNGGRWIETLSRRGYRYIGPIVTTDESASSASTVVLGSPPALPDLPSIATLPFENLSGDAEQEYFCDGMVEDIITGLSQMKWLFVIARNSSFTYKHKAVDVKQVGRELGVRYVLEGSVRKTASRVRITGRLIDAATGAQVWADRFEAELADIFDLQDQITSSVVGAIEPALTAAEIRRSLSKPTASLDAYDYYLRALNLSHSTLTHWEDGVALCKKAIALDANFALAYALGARFHSWRNTQGLGSNEERNEGIKFALRALDLANDNPGALWMGGQALMHLAREFERSLAAIERSLAIDSNSAFAWHARGNFHWWNGDGERAIQDFERSIRLSPRDPYLDVFHLSSLGWAHFVESRYEEAIRYSELALNRHPNNAASTTALRCKIASLAQLGRMAEAKEALALLRRRQPNPTVALLREAMPMRRERDIARYLDGLRKAGLPE